MPEIIPIIGIFSSIWVSRMGKLCANCVNGNYFHDSWKGDFKMKIGIKLDDSGFSNIDLSYPELGNPGMEGASFEEVLLQRD